MNAGKPIAAFAWATAGLTFILICWGGLVHNTGSSLACPDWPLCFGTLFPPMKGGIFYEHSHRLLGTTVGLCAVGLAIGYFRTRFRWLGLGGVLLVGVQAALGGLTVLYKLPWWVSTLHLGVSMIVFAILLTLAQQPRADIDNASLRRAVMTTLGLVYAQMVLGAAMRHLGAGLACLDIPFCHGQAWPHDTIFQQLHMLHRWVGVAVWLGTIWVAVVARRSSLRGLGWAAPLLATLQVVLGLLSITGGLAVVPVTAHLGVAALLFATLLSMWLRTRASAVEVAATKEALA
jgi:heme A synthase